jgi:2'-5' RNA ligase
MVRCFLAIELPEEVTAELRAIQERFKKERMDFLRWVNPDGIHLTLKFLGEVPEETIAGLGKAMGEAARGVAQFGLELDGLGVFPNLRSPRVFWAGLSGQVEVLKTLQQNIDAAFTPLGFEREARGFTAHLTLARVHDEATAIQRQSLGDLVVRNALGATPCFMVRSVVLMRSQLRPTGAIYTRLVSIPLAVR